MRSFVCVAIALLTMATVATAGVTMQLSHQSRSMDPTGLVFYTPPSTESYTFNLYVNFQVDAGTPVGARSVEARIGASASDVATINASDWTSLKNTNSGKYPGLMSKYHEVGGPFYPFYQWYSAGWLNMALQVDGSINTSGVAGCHMPYCTAGRIGGVAGTYNRASGYGPGGVFLPVDGVLGFAILQVHLPDLAPGLYHLNVCDATYTDAADDVAKPVTPGDDFIIEVIPEPTSALLLIGALPFLRRRR
jgi:hypothetical protein